MLGPEFVDMIKFQEGLLVGNARGEVEGGVERWFVQVFVRRVRVEGV